MSVETLPLKVARIRRVAEGIQSYELVRDDGGLLPEWEPGAHVDVAVPGGLVRQYSLCGEPDDRARWLIAVQREAEGRGGSRGMHDRVREGDVLAVSAPRNHFALVPAERYVLVAGGIGITPLLAMARVLEARGAAWELHYCTRSPERAAFLPLLTRAPFAPRVRVYHDGGDPGRGLDVRALLARRTEGTHVYCCGPTGLMSAVRDAAAGTWPREALHFESFGGQGADPFGPGASDVFAVNDAFEVEVRSTGRVFEIPRDQTILNVLRAGGLCVPSSCEAGECGTCVTPLLEGEAEHRDTVLTPEARAAQKEIAVCVSRARSRRLKLDL